MYLHVRYNSQNTQQLPPTTAFGWGHVVVQVVEALRYKPEGVTGIFKDLILRAAQWSLREISTRGFVGLTTLLPSSADCLEI